MVATVQCCASESCYNSVPAPVEAWREVSAKLKSE